MTILTFVPFALRGSWHKHLVWGGLSYGLRWYIRGTYNTTADVFITVTRPV